jgi:hypothetical protein
VRWVGTNLAKVIFHEHVMAKSSVARNSQKANRQASTFAFLAILLEFLHNENKDEIIHVVTVNKIIYV